MLSKEPVIDANDEAKVLGLNTPDSHLDAPSTTKKTANKDDRM